MVRQRCGRISAAAALAILLTGCGGSQTGSDLQSQHHDAERSAERSVEQWVAQIHDPQSPVINQGQDLGCWITSSEAPFSPNRFSCVYVYDVYALDGSADTRPPLATLLVALRAAGWSFLHTTIPGQQATVDTQVTYDQYRADPSYLPFPIDLQRAGEDLHVMLTLDLITSRNPTYGGRTRFQHGLIDPLLAKVRAGEYLYGFEIRFVYAAGSCGSCPTNDGGLQSLNS